jgi:hypothetical protein
MCSETEEAESEFGTILVSEVIFSRDDVRVLSRNVEFSVKWNAEFGIFVLFNEEFGIHVHAPALKEAMLDINDSLRLLYDDCLLVDDDNLKEDAVLLKKKLAELSGYNSGVLIE